MCACLQTRCRADRIDRDESPRSHPCQDLRLCLGCPAWPNLGGMPSRAIANARRAAGSLARSNADRRSLAPPDEASDGSGALRRLTRAECLQLLTSRRVGRFAHVESARALDVVPVNFVSRADGAILFRTGPGPKLSAAERGDVVAFEVDDIDETRMTGWSVLVVGRAKRLRRADVDGMAAALPQPWAMGPRHHVVLIEPTRIEGRRLT